MGIKHLAYLYWALSTHPLSPFLAVRIATNTQQFAAQGICSALLAVYALYASM